MNPNKENSYPFEIERTFPASPQRVYQAWTDREQFANWFGPKGFEIPVCRMEISVGGRTHYCMKGPGGQEMWGLFVYQEIVPDGRLRFTNAFSNADGEIVQPAWNPEWPAEVTTEVLFHPDPKGCRMVLRARPKNESEATNAAFQAGIPSMQGGWESAFPALEELVVS